MMRVLSIHKKTVSKIAALSEKELNLDKRYQYVKDNGVKVYGIVITTTIERVIKITKLPARTLCDSWRY